MNIAYVRVSTIDQNDERQIEGLKHRNIDKWFIEKASGKDTNRPVLKEMLDFAREGDSIFIHDFSRLARSTQDLLRIVETLKAKGIFLVSNKENIDTGTNTGKLMLTMIAAIAEFERANLLERQKEGIDLAKQRGAYKGRKEIDYPENWSEVMSRYNRREINASEAMAELSLKRNTFYKLLKRSKSTATLEQLIDSASGYYETKHKIIAAYQKVKARTGFSNVEIYHVQQELDINMESLKEFLKTEYKQGKVILSLGDWSLSDENIRSGAVYIPTADTGKPHDRFLLMRYKG
jgi:DNA invertase Pin-like site-specific DNA recombinase